MISLAAVRKKQGDAREALAVLERAAAVAPEVRARFIEPLERETLGQKKNAVGFEKIDARTPRRGGATRRAATRRAGAAAGGNDSREGMFYTPWLYEHRTPHT